MGSTKTKKTVVLKFTSMSNISYNYEYDTGIDRKSWNEMSSDDRDDIYAEAIWNDIDGWDVDE